LAPRCTNTSASVGKSGEVGFVLQVADDRDGLHGRKPLVRHFVEARDRVAALQQDVAEVGADGAGRTCNKNFHIGESVAV
jgi:hypothetical protein